MEEKRAAVHHVILEGRTRLTLSGVERVDSFDEAQILCRTVKGTLLIRGRGLQVDKLSVEGGELNVEGSIDSLEYEDGDDKRGGFWSRVFR